MFINEIPNASYQENDIEAYILCSQLIQSVRENETYALIQASSGIWSSHQVERSSSPQNEHHRQRQWPARTLDKVVESPSKKPNQFQT